MLHRRTSVVRCQLVIALAWLSSIVGCDEGSRVGETVPVAGKVTMNGKPLTTGSVAYYPGSVAKSEEMLVPGSAIDSEGNYKLFIEGKEGAPVGNYKVVVTASTPSNPKDEYSSPKSLVNARYTQPETTPLLIEVSADAPPGAYDLQVTK